MTSDEILLHRYSMTGDPGAFRELVDRYAGLVYSIAKRVTGDRHTAEDVSQDCFMELARKSRLVRENVAGWLHAVATSRSLNALRSRQRRICREQAVAQDGEVPAEPWEGRELQTLVDQALNGLSDDLRLPIILHYLQGEPQQQVADRLGINQATVSRRLQRGVEQLRKRLRAFGLMTTTMAVVSALGQSSAQAGPVPVAGTLAKIGLGGVGVTVAKSAPGGLSAATVMSAAVAANVLAVLFLRGWILFLIVAVEFALLMRPPSWIRELLRAQAFGRDIVAHPMYPFRRWTWTIPPNDWRQRLVLWSFVTFTFAVTAFGDPSDIATRPGFVIAFGLMAGLFLTLVLRLVWRVWQQRDRLSDVKGYDSEGTFHWTSRENAIGLAIVTGIAAIWLLSVPHEERFTWSKGTVLGWTWFTACAGMTIWILVDRWKLAHRTRASADVVSPAENQAELKAVQLRYHIVLIVGLILLVGCFLFSAAAQVLGVVKMQTPMKGSPPFAIMASTMGLAFSFMLLRRVIKVRNQLLRVAWLPLLAVSIVFVMMGLWLVTYGVEAAL